MCKNKKRERLKNRQFQVIEINMNMTGIYKKDISDRAK